MMKEKYIKLVNLCGTKGSVAWYRKLGDCFDFVNVKEYATVLTEEQCKAIMKSKDWYCACYNAEDMIIE